MIYTHYKTMPEILIDHNPEFEGVFVAVEQDNFNHRKHMSHALDELEAMQTARELKKWFKTDSVYDVYRNGKQIKSPILEVVR